MTTPLGGRASPRPPRQVLVVDSPADARPVRPTNYRRNLFHVASATVALAGILFLPHAWLIAVPGTCAFYAWCMEIGRRSSPRLNDRLMRFYAPLAHPHEHHSVNSGTWYASALFLLTLFATGPAMITAVVVLGVADPIAGFVGRRWGSRSLRAGRSLQGTLAFFASGTFAAAVALRLTHSASMAHVFSLAALAGFVGAVAELFSTKLDDNFTIPLAVGTVATVVGPALP